MACKDAASGADKAAAKVEVGRPAEEAGNRAVGAAGESWKKSTGNSTGLAIAVQKTAAHLALNYSPRIELLSSPGAPAQIVP